jgi:SlyX protein
MRSERLVLRVAARLSEGRGLGKAQAGGTEMADRDRLEETLAHLVRTVDDLSDMVARQDTEIAQLRARVDMLRAREAEREADTGGTLPLADRPPPHW